MKRFICIHGHFYQPPRENPWLEEIEPQESAAPFRDWNERVTAECYDPNRAARILDSAGDIDQIVNNYSRISFNFGPTLLAWLKRKKPATHAAIVAADRHSRTLFNGHGAAIAQAWGHIILPLASRRDKATQISWGIRDFEHHFGRSPEGMWLPETAVDLESLDLLAAAGMRFTILSPFQARRVRHLGGGEWLDVAGGEIDTRRPYLCRLPSGRSIALFFYDGAIARDIAFGGLLNSGEEFARRLIAPFAADERGGVVHVATDGESYGHHHRFGEMALAYTLQRLQREPGLSLSIYGEILDHLPPQQEVEIVPDSSWSCAHGVERWRSDCGCRTGGEAGWHQTWRAPLRTTLDWLRDRLAVTFEEGGRSLFTDPWAARDAYITVVLDRSPQSIETFLGAQARRALTPDESRRALSLLEMQRHAMQMFTSCGWFFDEVSGIETVQLLAYAGRAIQLAGECGAVGIESEFRRRLAQIPSNRARWGDAGRLYDELVHPAQLDLPRVAAHHAMASLFQIEEGGPLYCYQIDDLSRRQVTQGRLAAACGMVRIRSTVTWQEETLGYAALHYGNHHVAAGVRSCRDESALLAAGEELCRVVAQGDIDGAVRLLDRHFAGATYTLSHLFKEEQQRIVHRIIHQQVDEVLTHFRTIHEDHLALLRFLRELGMTVPAPLAAVAEQLLNDEILQLFRHPVGQPQRLRQLLDEVEFFGLRLEEERVAYVAAEHGGRALSALAAGAEDLERLHQALEAVRLARLLPKTVDLWQAQNIYAEIQQQHELLGATHHDPSWCPLFTELGHLLGMRLDGPCAMNARTFLPPADIAKDDLRSEG